MRHGGRQGRTSPVVFGSVLALVSVVFAAAVSVSASACAPIPAYDYAKEPDPRKAEYEIGPYDALKVTVWKNPDLSTEVGVRPDGFVTLPLIGDIKASGRTPSSLQREIQKRYSEFVRLDGNPVSVGVSQVNSYAFTVTGNVEKAGVFREPSYVTFLEALALAGGANRYASNLAYVVRGQPQRRIPIDSARATAGEIPSENIVILRGDLIVVQ